MPTINSTLEELKRGLSLATGAHHTIVLPSTVRVRMVGMLFESDKTFVLPSAMAGIRELKQVYDQHAGKTVLVSGHADRAGTTTHNLALSIERAEAVAAFLQDKVDDWLPRYKAGHQKSKVWGVREDQYMLSLVPAADGKPYLARPLSGRNDAATKKAVQRFQEDNGLPKGTINEDTRRLLIEKYMATDGTTLPPGTPLVTHGCGEYHPAIATEDSVALAENRRVELFFFAGPVEPAPVDPCPDGGCAGYPAWVERTRETIDINADPEVVVFLVDEIGLPLKDAAIKLVLPDGTTVETKTDDQGKVRPRVKPGTTFDVVVMDVHEGGPQDSLVTESGHHFAAGGDGPASTSGGTP
jgi:outer membrane protein OmpA-like peptidoglycan-associated protein